ncbi:hypothetical protein B0J14DRAFT_645331 [Halenospora varia]|nr:hypothetical protein B0J14DRAFT_645331 [Halenospora varia]
MANVTSWDDSCDWPRRLLYIKTMTSYPWQPGNKYGDQFSPRYNAISYTWGRWKLQDGDHPNVEALHVTGVRWPIPRINPDHFTVDELISTIKIATVGNVVGDDPPVGFIWLDVACIDQTPNSKENASEVGRQAKIFNGATKFAWLTSFRSASDFAVWHSQSTMTFFAMRTPGFRPFHEEKSKEDLVEDMLNNTVRLLQEPWCTSLWTLQEAFLRPDTMLLFREHKSLPSVLPNLESAFLWMNHLMSDAQMSGLKEGDLMYKLGDMVSKLGFLPADHILRAELETNSDDTDTNTYLNGPSENPFHLLRCCKARTTLYEEDRVYAIMQVFDFRLGKSAPNASRTDFTFDELKVKLDDALMHKYPIASQLIIQPQHCQPADGWIMHPDGIVSTAGEAFWNNVRGNMKVKNHATLGSRLHNGQRWGSFRGPIASFADVRRYYGPLVPELDQRWWPENSPDAGDQLARFRLARQQAPRADGSNVQPEIYEIYRAEILRRKEDTVNWDDWVKTTFPNLMVLLLGTGLMTAQENIFFQAYAVCLNPICVPCEDMCYERIGTVQFEPKGLISSTQDGSRTMKRAAWHLDDSNKIWIFDSKGLFG